MNKSAVAGIVEVLLYRSVGVAGIEMVLSLNLCTTFNSHLYISLRFYMWVILTI